MTRSARPWLLVAVFALTFVIATIATFPARLAYRLASPPASEILCRHVTGTIWKGEGTDCLVHARLRGRLGWIVDTSPAGLFDLFGLHPHIRITWQGRHTTLRAWIRLGTLLSIRHLRGSFPLHLVESLIPSLSFMGVPHGTLLVRRLALDFGAGKLGPIRGSARLLHGRLGEGLGLPLGTISLEAHAIGEQTRIEIRTLHPVVLGISAMLILRPHGAYHLTATLSPGPNVPASLRALLAGLPPGPRPGTRLFHLSGILPLAAHVP